MEVPIPPERRSTDYNTVIRWAETQVKVQMVKQKEAAIPNPNELEREATEVIKAVASTLDELYLNNGSWNGCADIAPDFIKKLESKGFVIVAKT